MMSMTSCLGQRGVHRTGIRCTIIRNHTIVLCYYERSISGLIRRRPSSTTTGTATNPTTRTRSNDPSWSPYSRTDNPQSHRTHDRSSILSTHGSGSTTTTHPLTTSSRQYHSTTRNKDPRYTSPTFFQLVRAIPAGLRSILKDVRTYRLIEDASRTKTNAWTKPKRPQTRTRTHGSADAAEDDRPGLIPRRQSEQQRRLLRELRLVALPLTFCLLPVVGNAFILGIILAPRYFLSDRFLEGGHVRSFRAKEWERRRGRFGSCAEGFGEGVGGLVVVEEDRAGPVFGDLAPLGGWEIPDVSSMDRARLLALAQTTPLSSPLLHVLPHFYISYRLKSLLHDIVRDDLLLIREKHRHRNCIDLTDEEVLDACALRGLPTEMGVGKEGMDGMRECLGNYLGMVEGWRGSSGSLVLYLPAIRYQWKKKMLDESS